MSEEGVKQTREFLKCPIDEQKKELINILQNINNPKMINYILNFIKAFQEIRF